MNAAVDAENLLSAARAEQLQQLATIPRMADLTTGELRDVLVFNPSVKERQRAVFEFELRCMEAGAASTARTIDFAVNALLRPSVRG